MVTSTDIFIRYPWLKTLKNIYELFNIIVGVSQTILFILIFIFAIKDDSSFSRFVQEYLILPSVIHLLLTSKLSKENTIYKLLDFFIIVYVIILSAIVLNKIFAAGIYPALQTSLVIHIALFYLQLVFLVIFVLVIFIVVVREHSAPSVLSASDINRILTNLRSGTPTDLPEAIPETKCAVCLEEYKINDTLTMFQCKHAIHSTCARPIITTSGNCPICRKSLVPVVNV